MICRIAEHPADILRLSCSEVSSFDGILLSIVRDMTDTMRYNIGVGIAAPQIGISKRIIVVSANHKSIPMINPHIIRQSATRSYMTEGCLSLPGYSQRVSRPKEIEVCFQDLRGQESYFIAQGDISHIIQHEIDHLNGVLILDYA